MNARKSIDDGFFLVFLDTGSETKSISGAICRQFITTSPQAFHIADGHAEIRKWLDGGTKIPGIAGVRIAPRDTPWIQERTSSKK
jgi:hypothetical protein